MLVKQGVLPIYVTSPATMFADARALLHTRSTIEVAHFRQTVV